MRVPSRTSGAPAGSGSGRRNPPEHWAATPAGLECRSCAELGERESACAGRTRASCAPGLTSLRVLEGLPGRRAQGWLQPSLNRSGTTSTVTGHRWGLSVNTRRPVKFKFPVNTGFLVRVSHTLLALRIIGVYLELECNGARATGCACPPCPGEGGGADRQSWPRP